MKTISVSTNILAKAHFNELFKMVNNTLSAVILGLVVLYTTQVIANEFTPDPYWQGTLGPLTIRSLSPGQVMRLAPIPRSPYGIPENQTELQFNVAAASLFIEEEGGFFMDLHFSDTRFAINHGFSHGWSANLSFNDRRVVNAHLDGITKKFHDAFGISQNGRDEVEENDTRIQIPAYGIDLGEEIKGPFSQTIGLSIQKVLIDKSIRWPAIAVHFNTSYETMDNGVIEHGSMDYGVQFSIAQKRNGGYLYGNISYTRFGSDNWLGVPLSEKQLSGMLGYEVTTGAHQAFIVQYLFSEGIFEDLGALSEYSHEIHFGYKWRTESFLWEAGLVENIVNFDNSPDVAFTFGITYKI